MVEEKPLPLNVFIFLPEDQKRVTNFCVKVGDGKLIFNDDHWAKWANEKRSGVIVYTETTEKGFNNFYKIVTLNSEI